MKKHVSLYEQHNFETIPVLNLLKAVKLRWREVARVVGWPDWLE